MGVVLLLAGFLRLYKLGQQSFIADEYLGINASYGYSKTDQWKFWDFNQEKITDEVYTRAKVYYWQVAQVFHWLQVDEAAARVVSVGWGMLGVLAIFGAVYYFSGSWVFAFLAALFLAISPTALTFDRKLRMYSMFAPVFFLFSLSVFLLLEKKSQKVFGSLKKLQEKTGLNFLFLPVVFCLGILSLATHLLTVNIFPIVFVYLLITAGQEYFKTRKIFSLATFYLLGMVAVTLLAIQNQEIKAALNFFSWVSNWSYFEKVVFDYSHPVLAGSFLLLGMYYLIKNFSRWGLWVVTNFLTILLLAAFAWKRSAGLQYSYLITPFKIIVFSSGVYFLVDFLTKKLFSDSRRAFWLMIAFLFLLLPNWGFFLSKDSFYQDIKKWSYSNYREVFGYYLRNRAENNVLITRYATNFYLWGTQSKVVDYNEGEEKLTLEKVLQAENSFDDVWVVFSGTMYIKGEARDYIRTNFKKIETKYTNDRIEIWRWQKSSSD